MSGALRQTRPMMGTTTGFHDDVCRRLRVEKAFKLRSCQPASLEFARRTVNPHQDLEHTFARSTPIVIAFMSASSWFH